MRRKANGKAGSPRMARQSAADDPGFTATEASSSEGKGSKSEIVEDRESGLKQAGLSDLGGTGPRRKTQKK
jgi:hypothetical protein